MKKKRCINYPYPNRGILFCKHFTYIYEDYGKRVYAYCTKDHWIGVVDRDGDSTDPIGELPRAEMAVDEVMCECPDYKDGKFCK